MLQTVKHLLSKKTVILASSSPRRADLLQKIGLDMEVFPADIEENLPKSSYKNMHLYPVDTAALKTRHVLKELLKMEKPVDIVIGADTVIIYENEIIEKPKDKEDAFRMLNRLNGNTHEVVTGVYLAWRRDGDQFEFDKFHEVTQVQMANVEPNVWTGYIDTGEPMDKAGGYGIQGLGGTLIKGITGDYYNVMGLPLHSLTYRLFRLVKDEQLAQDDEDNVCDCLPPNE